MSKRILVVEDQPDSRRIIRDMVAGTDYEITEAENGEEALAAIAKQRPDLILMDIQLPIMDGYTATRLIKTDPALRSIPIIAVTSYALAVEEKKARAAGCDDYVTTGEDSAVHAPMIIVCAVLEAVLDVIWYSFGSHFGCRHYRVRCAAAVTIS